MGKYEGVIEELADLFFLQENRAANTGLTNYKQKLRTKMQRQSPI